jgi:hypothetical protein
MKNDIPTYALVASAKSVAITEEDYVALASALKGLLGILVLEEKLDLMLCNHVELEADLLSISLNDAYFSAALDDKFHDNRRLINRRLVNLLSSCGAYRDCAKKTVAACLQEGKKKLEELNARLSFWYDNNLGYLVMEEMRDFVVHRGFPVQVVSYQSEVHEDESRNRHSHNVSFFAKTEHLLEDSKFQKKTKGKLSALGEKIDLRPLVRDYVECLATTHTELRSQYDPMLQEWKSKIEAAMAKFSLVYSLDPARELFFCIKTIDGKSVDELFVSLNSHARLQMLMQKNSAFGNFGKRYVTNAVT